MDFNVKRFGKWTDIHLPTFLMFINVHIFLFVIKNEKYKIHCILLTAENVII